MQYTITDHNEFQKHYENESDRSAAILASSFLDNCLEQFLTERLADHSIKERMFKGYGPLATFSARSDIALLVGLLPEHIYRDLAIIRKIRNLFAHAAEPLTFDDTKVRDLANNLLPARGFPKSDGTTRVISGARNQFFASITWSLLHIQTERDRTSKLSIPKFRFEEVVDDGET